MSHSLSTYESEYQSARGMGYKMPVRASDCTGRRPSWYPFQRHVCDLDDPDPVPFTGRQLRLPPA